MPFSCFKFKGHSPPEESTKGKAWKEQELELSEAVQWILSCTWFHFKPFNKYSHYHSGSVNGDIIVHTVVRKFGNQLFDMGDFGVTKGIFISNSKSKGGHGFDSNDLTIEGHNQMGWIKPYIWNVQGVYNIKGMHSHVSNDSICECVLQSREACCSIC
jgi:hypothetical protein